MTANTISQGGIDEVAAGSAKMWSTRLLLITFIVPLTILGLGVKTAMIWLIIILTAEVLSAFASAPFRRPQERTAAQRRIYLLSSSFTICAWLALGTFYWLSGEPALMVTAMAIWACQLIYVQGFMHSARITLIIGGAPTILVMIGVPLIFNPFEGALPVVVIGSLVLMALFGWRAAKVNYQTRQALRRATEALEKEKRSVEAASEAKSAFLATMSHELRTPLNGVLGMAHALQHDALSDTQGEKVRTIIDSGQLLTAVLNDILDLSKIEAGKLEIAPVEDNFHQALRRVVRLFEPQASDNAVALTLEVDASTPERLRFDPMRVRQCLSNLLSNAVKFTQSGHIEVRCSTEDQGDGLRVIIEVADTGIGMSDEAVQALFTPFTQADASITRRFAGTGLGLSIVRQLARLMGGDVSAVSAEGQGSTFTLELQAERAAEAPADAVSRAAMPEAEARSILREHCVLVVDDNAVNRQVARVFLKEIDCDVTEAADGAEALIALDTRVFDIVLMDIHMPNMDGLEAIKRIRAGDEAWRNIPVVALTADAMENDRARYLKAGMDSYAAKPFDPRQLFSAMAAAIETRRKLTKAA